MAGIILLAILAASTQIHGFDINADVQTSYDYIVVGCGISGLVVTNRLSEDRSTSVLCIEAGIAYVCCNLYTRV